jgi:phage repressor protein C with HTH and peptisase S24 domain/DNA-binding XRE family transcriptional regulator
MTPNEVGETIKNARELKRWSQETLAAHAGGVGQSTIDRIEKGQFKRFPSDLPALCAALGIALPDMEGRAPPAGGMLPVTRDRDFPIYASAEGGPGEILRSTDPIDFVPRPSPVAHVKEAYGLVITGTSMAPEFKPGETALVNPKLPVISDEVYVFYAEQDGEARATIKHLRRATGTEWLVSQHNPPKGRSKDFSLSRREWRWAHRVFGKHSRQ